MGQQQQQHFLVVAYPLQGHISPARALARRISLLAGGATRVTLSTSVFAHRRMFASAPPSDGLIHYVPYSDGFDDSPFDWFAGDAEDFTRKFFTAGPESLSAVVDAAAAGGHPVTCIVYTITLSWAARVARSRGIRCALYWVQPAAVLAAYYHYFHGYGHLVDAHAGEPEYVIPMPGMPKMKIRSLPSHILNQSDRMNAFILEIIRKTLDSVEPTDMVLVNTADVLEPSAVKSVEEWNVVAVGPAIPALVGEEHAPPGMYKQDEKKYMEWLDAKPAMSVVYVSFGSLHVCTPGQLEGVSKALAGCGRPFLWVVREAAGVASGNAGEGGMAVEWCDQVKVLGHPAVGCFVTHCGWNSTLEGVAFGVPMVALPQRTDQEMNAGLVAGEWNVGVRGGDVGQEGGIGAEELKKGIEMVMGEGGGEMRRNAREMKVKVRAAVGAGGSSELGLKAFLDYARRHE